MLMPLETAPQPHADLIGEIQLIRPPAALTATDRRPRLVTSMFRLLQLGSRADRQDQSVRLTELATVMRPADRADTAQTSTCSTARNPYLMLVFAVLRRDR